MAYNECAKQSEVQEQSMTLTEFVDWLDEQGIHLAEYAEGSERLYPIMESYEKLFARFFNIDLDVAEAEKQHMLQELRK